MKEIKKEENIPKKPYQKRLSLRGSEMYSNDFYCPSCSSLAAYEVVGIRRINRGVQTSCRVCGQILDWRE